MTIADGDRGDRLPAVLAKLRSQAGIEAIDQEIPVKFGKSHSYISRRDRILSSVSCRQEEDRELLNPSKSFKKLFRLL
jgi:hypothetical protein